MCSPSKQRFVRCAPMYLPTALRHLMISHKTQRISTQLACYRMAAEKTCLAFHQCIYSIKDSPLSAVLFDYFIVYNQRIPSTLLDSAVLVQSEIICNWQHRGMWQNKQMHEHQIRWKLSNCANTANEMLSALFISTNKRHKKTHWSNAFAVLCCVHAKFIVKYSAQTLASGGMFCESPI